MSQAEDVLQEADAVFCGIEDSLRELVQWQEYKSRYGPDKRYIAAQEVVWNRARSVLQRFNKLDREVP